MAEYNPELPPLTIYGQVSSFTNKDKYGVNDETGLGPNGSDKYISFNLVIDNISDQELGDSSVRSATTLNLGGVYNGLDIKVGDWVADTAGAKILQITEITEKTSTYISCSVEDRGMAIARQRRDRNNTLAEGGNIIIFETNDNGQPLFASNQLADITTNNAIDGIQTYFEIYEPFQRFTFYPDETGSVEIGDLVTITGSIGGSPVTPYRLVPATGSDTTIGVVSDIFGGNNINVRPVNKIITNFSAPELLTKGEIGSTWYLSGSGAYSTSSADGDPKFFQLTNAIGVSLTGSYDNPNFDETSYNLIINNVEVIPQNAGGTTLSITEITSSINAHSNTTYVTAGINETGGGNASVTTGDGSATLSDPTLLAMYLDTGTGGAGLYPSAPGKFAITASGVSFEVHPTTADQGVYGGYPIASIDQIKSDIETAATSAGATITVTKNSSLSLTIEDTLGGNLTLNNIASDAFGINPFGAGSGIGMPTGTNTPPPLEKYLTLERTDGGDILLQGTWISSVDGSGLFGVSGTPPYLLMIEAAGGGSETYTNTTATPLDFPSSDNPSIPAGTTFSNKTFAEMMDLMLYPELNPTLTAPSNTFTISPSGLREIGEVISTITLNATFNRGSINPAYGTDGYRSGLPNTYVYTGTGTSNNSSTSLTDTETVSSYTVIQGNQSWTGAVSYDEGDQPLTSKGNNYDSPLPAGTTSAITRTITGVYPVFATTSTLGTLTKQSLQTMTTLIQVSMVAEDGGGNKQTIDIPDAWSTISGLQQFNTLSNSWDSISLSTFSTSAITKTIQGNTVNYTRYTHNGGTIGARQLRFTV